MYYTVRRFQSKGEVPKLDVTLVRNITFQHSTTNRLRVMPHVNIRYIETFSLDVVQIAMKGGGAKLDILVLITILRLF